MSLITCYIYANKVKVTNKVTLEVVDFNRIIIKNNKAFTEK